MKANCTSKLSGFYVIACLAFGGIVACLVSCGFQSEAKAGAFLGSMKADRILFLGNSVTLAGTYNDGPPDAAWGCAATERSKDYVHLLASSIGEATGTPLELTYLTEVPGRWYYGDPLPNYEGNILNIADIFERNYDTWKNIRIQNQLDAQPDIVVLQFGENLAGGTSEELATALDKLLDGLKSSSDPNIFITSNIIGSNPAVDAIKQQACAADPSRRVFVNLSGIVDNSGYAGHPSDAGMQTIADTIFDAMVAHSVPLEQGMVPNGSFDTDLSEWTEAGGGGWSWADAAASGSPDGPAAVFSGAYDTWLYQPGCTTPPAFIAGRGYELSFLASGSGASVGTILQADITTGSGLYSEFVTLTDSYQEYSIAFTATADDVGQSFQPGFLGKGGLVVKIDSVSLVPVNPVVAGDANGDGQVDGSDVTILAGNWQKGVSDGLIATWGDGDFNGDQKVDGSDVTILAGNWQVGVEAAASAVPEPSTLALLLSGCGLVGLAIWRRRR